MVGDFTLWQLEDSTSESFFVCFFLGSYLPYTIACIHPSTFIHASFCMFRHPPIKPLPIQPPMNPVCIKHFLWARPCTPLEGQNWSEPLLALEELTVEWNRHLTSVSHSRTVLDIISFDHHGQYCYLSVTVEEIKAQRG